MRPGWKKAAEYADRAASAAEETQNASAAAFAGDWKADVPDSLARGVHDVFCGQNSLFPGQQVSDLEALRRVHAGHGMAQVLIDCAVQIASSGRTGEDAAVEAVSNTLAVWGPRHARQIEEHFHRKSTERRANKVRTRLEDGISGAQQSALARQLLKLDGTAAPRRPQKQTGLDDGVSL